MSACFTQYLEERFGMKRTLLTICMMICLLLCFHQYALAEDDFDYHIDSRMFGSKVAELNIEIAEHNQGISRRGERETLILFQTSEIPLKFDDACFKPLCVVYGPEGFSVLVCRSNPEQAVQWLLSQKSVIYAEADSNVSGCSTESDPSAYAFHSWGAQSADFGMYETFAREHGNGTCSIAVIDSGVFPHSLIAPKLLLGGHDYIDNDNDPTNDLNGHGTRVAGIVADCTQELPVTIFPIRVLDEDANGKTSNVISAVLEAIDAQVDIINLSLSTFSQSELLESAIRSAISSGITVVAAAGNYACDAAEVTPGGMTEAGILVVGSVEANGSRSSFSNYGNSVDVYFYGRNIECCSRSGGYITDSGTSMAAPHISALCAMVKLTHPLIRPEEIASRIQSSSSEGICIPCASAMVPQSLGFQLRTVSLRVGESMHLPGMAIPESAQENIRYESSDSDKVEISGSVVRAKAQGQAEITVRCKGFADCVVSVNVNSGYGAGLNLPPGLTFIEEEAFYGIRTDYVTIPFGTQAIGSHAFDGGAIWFVTVPETVGDIGDNSFSGAVILCREDTPAHLFAQEHNLQYLLQNDIERRNEE